MQLMLDPGSSYDITNRADVPRHFQINELERQDTLAIASGRLSAETASAFACPVPTTHKPRLF